MIISMIENPFGEPIYVFGDREKMSQLFELFDKSIENLEAWGT